jgi:hypothetical protein
MADVWCLTCGDKASQPGSDYCSIECMEADLGPVPEGKVRHAVMPQPGAVQNFVDALFIEHEDGLCCWCDALRWRGRQRGAPGW